MAPRGRKPKAAKCPEAEAVDAGKAGALLTLLGETKVAAEPETNSTGNGKAGGMHKSDGPSRGMRGAALDEGRSQRRAREGKAAAEAIGQNKTQKGDAAAARARNGKGGGQHAGCGDGLGSRRLKKSQVARVSSNQTEPETSTWPSLASATAFPPLTLSPPASPASTAPAVSVSSTPSISLPSFPSLSGSAAYASEFPSLSAARVFIRGSIRKAGWVSDAAPAARGCVFPNSSDAKDEMWAQEAAQDGAVEESKEPTHSGAAAQSGADGGGQQQSVACPSGPFTPRASLVESPRESLPSSLPPCGSSSLSSTSLPASSLPTWGMAGCSFSADSLASPLTAFSCSAVQLRPDRLSTEGPLEGSGWECFPNAYPEGELLRPGGGMEQLGAFGADSANVQSLEAQSFSHAQGVDSGLFAPRPADLWPGTACADLWTDDEGAAQYQTTPHTTEQTSGFQRSASDGESVDCEEGADLSAPERRPSLSSSFLGDRPTTASSTYSRRTSVSSFSQAKASFSVSAPSSAFPSSSASASGDYEFVSLVHADDEECVTPEWEEPPSKTPTQTPGSPTFGYQSSLHPQAPPHSAPSAGGFPLPPSLATWGASQGGPPSTYRDAYAPGVPPPPPQRFPGFPLAAPSPPSPPSAPPSGFPMYLGASLPYRRPSGVPPPPPRSPYLVFQGWPPSPPSPPCPPPAFPPAPAPFPEEFLAPFARPASPSAFARYRGPCGAGPVVLPPPPYSGYAGYNEGGFRLPSPPPFDEFGLSREFPLFHGGCVNFREAHRDQMRVPQFPLPAAPAHRQSSSSPVTHGSRGNSVSSRPHPYQRGKYSPPPIMPALSSWISPEALEEGRGYMYSPLAHRQRSRDDSPGRLQPSAAPHSEDCQSAASPSYGFTSGPADTSLPFRPFSYGARSSFSSSPLSSAGRASTSAAVSASCVSLTEREFVAVAEEHSRPSAHAFASALSSVSGPLVGEVASTRHPSSASCSSAAPWVPPESSTTAEDKGRAEAALAASVPREGNGPGCASSQDSPSEEDSSSSSATKKIPLFGVPCLTYDGEKYFSSYSCISSAPTYLDATSASGFDLSAESSFSASYRSPSLAPFHR
ncbi:hypothetical protein BESB_066980 [Besnoitia besnoiti]|uniref:Uncharacterized protein n=1 Tax=Besnoitia besnoiti TaxID=94643 RepID=A0A2A9M9I7_BESBE|nr:hypothetical protein BESB_066980 [Besnoitia besnoiti]PFH34665.1 hypothetical protein BESB_066980 [Besnoitia besnoiti]